MKAVIQRVKWAEVWVEEQRVSRIERGILTLLGVEKGDTDAQVRRLMDQITGLRIFPEPSEAQSATTKMQCDLKQIAGGHLIVSQFTLAADLSGGRRPSFTSAAAPDDARALYHEALRVSEEHGVATCGGVFRAEMKVRLENDGPVTFVLEARP